MRVCYISTYPPTECGIATYTQYLADTIHNMEKEVLVVSQVGATGDKVFPAYSPHDNDIAMKLFHMASKLTPDIIHIQHEYGLYGSDHGVQIIDLMLRCKLADIPVVTTLHTLYREIDSREHRILLENITNNSSIIIVHEEYQKETLNRYFPHIRDKIRVIPHGVRDVKKFPDAKKKLGLENKKVILLAGYFRPTKHFDKLVEVFPEIAEKIDDAVLLVAGKMRGIEHFDYQTYFFDLLNNSPVLDRIEVLRGQFPQHTFDMIMSAADVIVLPYELGAQSGILAQSSAFCIPVVTSDLLSFKLWNEETGGGLTAKNDDDYVKHISRILTDKKFSETLQENIRKDNEKRNWDVVAKQHLLAYEEVIKVPYGKAKYFFVPEKE